MNQKSASVLKNEIFRRQSLPFNEIPKQSQLFKDFINDSQKINRFYPKKQSANRDIAAKVLAEYKIDRAALCQILAETNKSFGAGSKTFENIELLRREDCLAVVTGQQAGLFTGALYTIYKAFSAIKLAKKLRNENLTVVPVFWVAEEDHDFDEVKKTYNLDNAGKLFSTEYTPENYVENTPVGFVAIDEKINSVITNLFASLPHTEFSDQLKILISDAYQTGESYSSSFARLLTKLFADYGLIIVSPLDKNLKKLSAPLFAEAVEKSAAIADALIKRNGELKENGYQPQVLAEENFFPFFFQNENGERQPLRRNLQNGKIKIQKTKTEFDLKEFSEIARHSPERLSPNALMRPVVQDFLLPTIAYYGGAAEVAYFAQNSAVYQILDRPVTPIRHRAGLTIVARNHARTMEKYQLDFVDMFAGQEKLTARIVENFLDKDTAAVFEEVEETINARLDLLDNRLARVEPTLAANLATRRKKILWHIVALQNKYHRAAMEKNDITDRRIGNLFTALFPHNALQERTLNVLTFLNQYGGNFIDWIYQAIESDDDKHQILYL